MTIHQNGGLYKIIAAVVGSLVVGTLLFIFQSQWSALSILETRLADHKEEAAGLYVPRSEFIEALNRLEDAITEAIRDAKSSGR